MDIFVHIYDIKKYDKIYTYTFARESIHKREPDHYIQKLACNYQRIKC